MKDIKGKKAIVTGGAMGFGLATCKELLKEGCDVTIWDLSMEAMEKARKELDKIGTGKVYTYQCDVSDQNRVKELTAQARKDMGRIDILINNAAFQRMGSFAEQPIEAMLKQNDVNINALLYTMKAVMPEMMERNSGWIVNISSAASIFSFPKGSIYTASKFWVHGICDVLRLEMKVLGKKGVKIISVHPGLAGAGGGMFGGMKLSMLASLVAPLCKPDVLAKRIVENGIKKGRTVVMCPRSIYLFWMLRGWIPNPLWDWQLRILGFPEAVDTVVGRPGFAHADPRSDKKT
jgi:all-trans-retinol dehydrogenase (NAD+)